MPAIGAQNERIIQKSNHRLTRFRISIHLHLNRKTVNDTYYSRCIDNCSDGQSFSLNHKTVNDTYNSRSIDNCSDGQQSFSLRNKYQLTPGSQLVYVTAVQPFDWLKCNEDEYFFKVWQYF